MAKFGIGQSVRRVEDPRLLTGGGRYTDDTKLSAPAARAYVLRSPHAHADIKSIDTTAARKAPGVLLVLTGEDVKKAGYGDLPSPRARKQPRWHPARRHPAPDAGPGPRPSCRRPGSPGCRREPGTGQGRLRADRGRLRSPPPHRRHLRVRTARRTAGPRPHQGQPGVRLGDGRSRQDGDGLCQGRPRREAARSSTTGWS